jgi:hypothetical protein
MFALRAMPGAQVERGNVKPPPTIEETYRGVAAPSRPKVQEAPELPKEMPKVTWTPSPIILLLYHWYYYIHSKRASLPGLED